MNPAAWAVVFAALIAATIAPWVKGRIDQRNNARNQHAASTQTLATATEARVKELFIEQAQMRDAYRSDLEDTRAQLRESNARLALLEREVAEWRAGVRGVVGVWVAVPAHVMEYIRDNNLPGLPTTRFPGEREIATGSDTNRP